MSMELDALDRLAASAFDGYLVRKDLVRKYSRQYPVPTYVVEFLLGRYCASVDENEINEGLQIVEKQLKDRTVRTGEEELFKARAKETGSVKLIDIVRARLDAKNDCYLAELPSLNLRDVQVGDRFVKEHERMLTDGFYSEVTLGYDAVIAQDFGIHFQGVEDGLVDPADALVEGRRYVDGIRGLGRCPTKRDVHGCLAVVVLERCGEDGLVERQSEGSPGLAYG